MKGEMKMKRFLCVLLACLMIVPSAFAIDVFDFNMYTDIFGGTEIADGQTTELENGTFTEYKSDGCRIIFRETDGSLNTLYVIGEGEPFIIYSCAALMFVDDTTSNASTNIGNFVLGYLMAKGSDDTDPHMSQTVSGSLFGVNKEAEGGFMFMVMK